MKKIAILGSTGSIGVQTLDVIECNKSQYKVTALIANSNKDLLKQQQVHFGVDYLGILDESLRADDGFDYGAETLLKAVDLADVIVVATRGIIALRAVIKALKQGKRVAIANKECIISAGELLLDAKREGNALLLPVDSEHSAIFQCLNGNQSPQKILLTCSGGAFFGKNADFLNNVTAMDALKHPKWQMGSKITIDSATLINKGFEVLEARWFFDVEPKNVEVLIHPQSIVHSLVEYSDGSVLAQLATTDMRLPISYALSYPDRLPNTVKRLDLKQVCNLQFFNVDKTTFKGIDICIDSYYAHKLMPAVLVAADEVVVEYFLKDKIKFNDIYDVLQKVMDYYKTRLDCIKFDVDGIMFLDDCVKKYTKQFLEEKYVVIS